MLDFNNNLREFACLTTVILAPLRMEGVRTASLLRRPVGEKRGLSSYTTVGFCRPNPTVVSELSPRGSIPILRWDMGRQNSAQIPPQYRN